MNAHTSRKQLRRRDERFLSRQELAERWGISVREVIRREKDGILSILIQDGEVPVNQNSGTRTAGKSKPKLVQRNVNQSNMFANSQIEWIHLSLSLRTA
jgi:hypothetical protein